jgi:flavin-dependent dehydrogenase
MQEQGGRHLDYMVDYISPLSDDSCILPYANAPLSGQLCEGQNTVDVCVFGAGPAGLSVAARLMQRGIRVVILDRPPRTKSWGGESFTGAIRAPLLAIGGWEAFERAGHVQGYERESAWGGPARVESSIVQPHGPLWHVDRDRFDADLRLTVLHRAEVLIGYRKVDRVTWEPTNSPGTLARKCCTCMPRRTVENENSAGSGLWRVEIDGKTRVSASFLVDATGRARVVARRLHARVETDDQLIGLTSAVPCHANREHVIRSMLMEATPFGWWYASPTPAGHTFAFFTDADLAPPNLRQRLRPVAANSAFTHVPPDQNWLAVGDACASHDPLCGWGVHRAMINGLRAADAIETFLSQNDRGLLEEYRLHVRQQYQQYLRGLSQQYSLEQRWLNAPFWKRRHHHLSASQLA